MNYRLQTMTEAATDGFDARNVYRQALKRSRLLAKHAHELCREVAQGRGPGTVPIVRTADGFAPIPILDCPANWTPAQCAQFRELGQAMIDRLNRDPRLADLVRTYLAGAPDYRDRGRMDRLRKRYGVAFK